MSGPKLGRPAKNRKSTREEYQDNTDRIEVERFFSKEKRCSGAGLIMTKLEATTLSSIALSVLVTNLFAVRLTGIFLLYFVFGCGWRSALWIIIHKREYRKILLFISKAHIIKEKEASL